MCKLHFVSSAACQTVLHLSKNQHIKSHEINHSPPTHHLTFLQ